MLERAISGYWILYVMMGICTVGVVSRLWLAGIYSGLLKDVQYTKEPKRKLMKQMREKYETCYRLSEGINNVEAFLVRNLYGYHFMGITLGGIQKISGQACFLCLLIGGLTASYTYAYGMPLELTIIYSAAAVGMATLLVYINCIFDVRGRQTVLEAGIVDYLQNYYAAILDKRKNGEEIAEVFAVEEIAEDRKGEKSKSEKLKSDTLKSETLRSEMLRSEMLKPETLRSDIRDEPVAEVKQPPLESATLRSEKREGRQAEKLATMFRRKERHKQPENTFAKEQAEQLLLELRKNPRRGRDSLQETENELDNLRSSLNQIAADLEKGRNGENRQLAEEEMRIVEEILGEFLA